MAREPQKGAGSRKKKKTSMSVNPFYRKMLPEGPSRDPPEEPKIAPNWPKVVFGVFFWTDRLLDTIFNAFSQN